MLLWLSEATLSYTFKEQNVRKSFLYLSPTSFLGGRRLAQRQRAGDFIITPGMKLLWWGPVKTITLNWLLSFCLSVPQPVFCRRSLWSHLAIPWSPWENPLLEPGVDSCNSSAVADLRPFRVDLKLNNGQRSAGIMTCDAKDSHKLWVKMRCNWPHPPTLQLVKWLQWQF